MALVISRLAATIIMSRRAERAAYSQIEGQAGAAGAALTSIRRGWYTDREPVAADVARPGDINSAAMVYRALGRPGVVLVGEGPTSRVQKLLATEKKRVERVAPGVPVTTMRVGSGENEVPLPKLASKVQRLKPQITKDEMALVNKRLKALGGLRAPLPPVHSDELLFRLRGGRTSCSFDGQRVRTMTVLGTLSCRPRPSRSHTTAGMNMQSSTVRARACTGRTRPLPPKERTCRPMTRWPMVKPTVPTSSR